MQPELMKQRAAEGPLSSLRQAAAARFNTTGWPSASVEAWRFTNLARLNKRVFDPALAGIAPSGLELPDGHRVVFFNGIYQPELSTDLPQAITLEELVDGSTCATLLEDGRLAGHPVADASMALLGSGKGLHVSGKVDAPLNIVFINDGNDTSSHPVIAVHITDGAEVTLLEHHIGEGSGLSLPVVAVYVGEGAVFNHGRIQAEGALRHHLGQAVFTVSSNAIYRGVSLQTGGVLSRTENHIAMAGEGADATLTTFYLARRDQVMDVTTQINHDMPSCTSMQIVRGVLDDTARGIFQGKVKVAPDAQKTDGNQMSRALLLSRKCEADAKPELEIYADDVACSHGATVGEIDDTELFYLMSRGIALEEARQMLIEAFLDDAIGEIDNPMLAEFIRPQVLSWLSGIGSAQNDGI
ncbi:Fe-S cluster assembly protein SufD [Alphaproteobacteria bacterium LSUCC0684]